MSNSKTSQPGKYPLMVFMVVVLVLTTAYIVMTTIENSSQVRLEKELKSQRAADTEAKELVQAVGTEGFLKQKNALINSRGLWSERQSEARNTLTLLEQLAAVHRRNSLEEQELLGTDAAPFAANPNEFVVLFTDFQKQIAAGTDQMESWRTRLTSIQE